MDFSVNFKNEVFMDFNIHFKKMMERYIPLLMPPNAVPEIIKKEI